MQFRVEVGLLILSLAFAVILFGGVWISEWWRLVVIFEANPHLYIDYIRDAFLYLILPPAVGLTFSIIAFIRETKSPTGILEWWLPLTVFGGFFFFWGILGLQRTYSYYSDAIQWIDLYGSVDIKNLILAFYATISVAFILWIFAGILFMLPSAFKMTPRNKREKLSKPER